MKEIGIKQQDNLRPISGCVKISWEQLFPFSVTALQDSNGTRPHLLNRSFGIGGLLMSRFHELYPLYLLSAALVNQQIEHSEPRRSVCCGNRHSYRRTDLLFLDALLTMTS
jgi:hypothetical protein